MLQLTASDLATWVCRSLHDDRAQPGDATVEHVNYVFGSPTTDGLYRVRGTAVSRGQEVPWSLFVKRLRSYRHWPVLPHLPTALREEALRSDAWRYEADLYADGLPGVLPDGMRLPEVWAIQALPDERLLLVLEDVTWDASPWDLRRFSSAARLLGQLSARLTRCDALPATASRTPGVVTRRFYTGRVEVLALPGLADPALWTHPLLTGGLPLRDDLLELGRRTPEILAHLERLPQVLVHGDASPQNLLVEAAPPHDLVVIDWMLGGLAAVGDDLGQLLVGLAHAGLCAVEELPAIRTAILSAHRAGLAEEGLDVDEASIATGLDGGLVVRSAFTSLPIERLQDPVTDELAELVATRLELTRYLVDLGLDLSRRLPSGTRGRPAVARR